ncbi:uncharacterized protein LOC131012862 [Salvia miltiorrhiza]|uniref:uncharacterized protein LOC131012862 n=1 Tax=Salvia miltiorrhiza TaxID=226208 RepID=UPI0025ACBF59|nr:uncharacterized protein LOC131012862 [Salvia miltiorrhiza]
MESTFVPNVELLKSCGVPIEQITRAIIQMPRFFLLKPVKMRKFIEKAEELGSDRGSRSFIRAVKVVSSMTSETLGVKMEALRELGFSDSDIARAFRNSPQVLATSPEKMRRVAEVVVGSGRYDRMSIVERPCVFMYSVEKRIWPRIKVLRVLEEKKKMIGGWPSLATMLTLTDAMFFHKFVSPNLEQDDCRAVS